MTTRLTLYHSPTCPYCLLVRREADALGIDLDLVDVRDRPEARDHLVRHLGRGTVPVLGIRDGDGERLLPESRDIVAYLRDLAPALAA